MPQTLTKIPNSPLSGTIYPIITMMKKKTYGSVMAENRPDSVKDANQAKRTSVDIKE